jgi:hypothetical protein
MSLATFWLENTTNQGSARRHRLRHFTRAAPQTGTQFRAERELLHSSFIFFHDLAILVILRMLRDGYIRRKSGRLGTDSPREWAVACS